MNSLVIGRTRSGKSTAVFELDAKPTINASEQAVFILDPHNQFGKQVAEYACHQCPERLLYEDLDELSWVSSFGFIKPARNPNPIYREAENREQAASFAEILTMQRAVPIEAQPMVFKWTFSALMLWLNQKTDLPLHYLPWAFRPGSKQFKEMMDGCTDPEVLYDFGLIERVQSVAKLEEQVGGAARLFNQTFAHMAFRLRTEPTTDLLDFTKKNGICIWAGGGHSSRVMMRALTFSINHQASTHWRQTGEPLPAKIYIDEAANFNLIGMTEANAMGQTIKMGLSWTIMSQTPDFGDDRVNTSVDQNCSRKIYMASANSNVAKLCAENMKTTLDPQKVKQYRTKQRHAGFKFQERKGTSTWESGEQKGKGESTNIAQIPIYEQYQEADLMPLNEQTELLAAELMKLPVGTAYISTDGIVVKTNIKPEGDIWTWPGLGSTKLKELLHHYRAIGVYKQTGIMEPCQSPSSPSAADRFGKGNQ